MFSEKKYSLYKKVVLTFSLVVGTVIFIILMFNVDRLHKATIGRFIDGTSNDSTGFRVVRGFQVFNELDINYKLVGVGYGNVTTFVLENEIRTENDLYAVSTNGTRIYNYEYMNCLRACYWWNNIFPILYISIFRSL